MTTNSEFSVISADLMDKLAGDIISPETFATLYRAALDDWSGAQITKSAIALKIADILEKISVRENQIISWYAGAANGGFDSTGTIPGGGYYPFTLPDGSTVWRVSPDRMLAVTQKGDAARNDICFSVSYALGAKEIIAGYIAAFPSSFIPSASKAQARRAPTNLALISIKKNMPPNQANPDLWENWGTITFAPGSNTGVIAIPSPVLTTNDYLDFVAPSTQDPTLNDVRVTLAGT